jgi:hypothetical protein
MADGEEKAWCKKDERKWGAGNQGNGDVNMHLGPTAPSRNAAESGFRDGHTAKGRMLMAIATPTAPRCVLFV